MVKCTVTETTALHFVGRVRKISPQDLLRERSLNDVVREYEKLTAKVAAAS